MGVKDTALRYKSSGFSVIPIRHRGKQPLVRWVDFQGRIADEQEISAWFEKWPNAGVAIVTGKISGLIVLDCDSDEGREFLKGKKHQITPVAETGKGTHYYFSHPGGEIKNLIRPIPGLDIKGDGGYVIAPPSVHPTGKSYQWYDGLAPWDTELAAPPGWLLKLIKQEPTRAPAGLEPRRVLQGVAEGERNQSIFRYACSLRAKNLDYDSAKVLILEAAERAEQGENPFPKQEALSCLDSAYQYPVRQAKLFGEEITDSPILMEAQGKTAKLTWPKEGIYARVKRLKEAPDGAIRGMLTLDSSLVKRDTPLYSGAFNFSAVRSRKEVARWLTEKAPLADWPVVLEALCYKVTEWMEKGVPEVRISSDEQTSPPQFILKPFILQDTPTIIYGNRSTAKSYTALLLAAISTTDPAAAAEVGFRLDQRCNPLYLDWEMSEGTVQERLRRLHQGMFPDAPPISLIYLPMARPLAADADRLATIILDNSIDLLIVDSLGPACGGDLNSAESAIAFFEALREFHLPSLIIAHTAKNKLRDRSIFGSVFFENLARSIWEVQAEQEPGELDLGVAFRHRKNSYGALEQPFGLEFFFRNDVTKVVRRSVLEIPGGEEAASTRYRIRDLLERGEVMDLREIAETLDLSLNTTKSALYRGRQKGEFVRLPSGKWAVRADDSSGGRL